MFFMLGTSGMPSLLSQICDRTPYFYAFSSPPLVVPRSLFYDRVVLVFPSSLGSAIPLPPSYVVEGRIFPSFEFEGHLVPSKQESLDALLAPFAKFSLGLSKSRPLLRRSLLSPPQDPVHSCSYPMFFPRDFLSPPTCLECW